MGARGAGASSTMAAVNWRRVGSRGAALAIAASTNLALFVWLLVPPAPRPLRARGQQPRTGTLRVSLLLPPPSTPVYAARPHALQSRAAPSHAVNPARLRRAAKPPQVVLLPAANSSARAPAYIPGGEFATRLQAAQAASPTPKLPGGHQYTAKPLPFISIERLSIAGHVHKYAGLLFGWFDPTCKNAEYELTKNRKQQLADGYTPEDLKRLMRDHCQ